LAKQVLVWSQVLSALQKYSSITDKFHAISEVQHSKINGWAFGICFALIHLNPKKFTNAFLRLKHFCTDLGGKAESSPLGTPVPKPVSILNQLESE
jgi:hypothetical protein